MPEPYVPQSRLLAELMARRHNPVQSIGQGLADVAGDVGEAYFLKKAAEEEDKKEKGNAADLVRQFMISSDPNTGTLESGKAMGYNAPAQQTFPQSQTSAAAMLAQAMQGQPARGQQAQEAFRPMDPNQRASFATQQTARTNPQVALQGMGQAYELAQRTAPQKPRYQPVEGIGLVEIPAEGKPSVALATPPARDPNEMTAWQKAQIEAQNRRLDAAEARAAAVDERANRPQATAFVSALSGNPVRLDPATQTYKDGDNAIPADKLVPASDFNKEVEKGRALVSGTARADKILAMVNDEKNKTAFDKSRVREAMVKRAIGPGKIGDQWASGVFTEDENTLRANVARDSAMIINELYGAALSAGEETRASTFAPNPDDTLEMLIPKLKAAQAWAKEQEKGVIPGALEKARSQLQIDNAEAEAAAAPSGTRPSGVPEDARKAPDGKWYSPDPLRPGKYVQW